MARSAIHPGEHLAEQLEALDMTAAELGRQLKVPANRITEILNGQRTVTGDTGAAARTLFSHERAVLVELAGDLRSAGAERKCGQAIKALPTLQRPAKKAGSGEHPQQA